MLSRIKLVVAFVIITDSLDVIEKVLECVCVCVCVCVLMLVDAIGCLDSCQSALVDGNCKSTSVHSMFICSLIDRDGRPCSLVCPSAPCNDAGTKETD
jgi:hypothetical protein